MPDAHQTYFDPLWMMDDTYKEYRKWLQPVTKDKTLYWCSLCNKSNKLSNMGIEALKSHVTGGKHKKRAAAQEKQKMRSATIQNFFSGRQANVETESVRVNDECIELPSGVESETEIRENVPGSDNSANTESESTSTSSSKPEAEPPKQKSVLCTFNDDYRVKAEVIWALNSINKTFSFNSHKQNPIIFKSMFPDS